MVDDDANDAERSNDRHCVSEGRVEDRQLGTDGRQAPSPLETERGYGWGDEVVLEQGRFHFRGHADSTHTQTTVVKGRSREPQTTRDTGIREPQEIEREKKGERREPNSDRRYIARDTQR